MAVSQFDNEKTLKFISKEVDDKIVPTLETYVKIPNQSPLFDSQWRENGYLHQAAELYVNYAKDSKIGHVELVQLKDDKGLNRTPVVFIEVPASDANNKETVLLYGHLDKQPPLLPWAEGLHPYTPVIKDGKLYGRGSSDDGYAMFGAIASIANLKAQGLPHARYVILIEACEESGSPDLPAYINHLEAKIGTPSLIVCLDSGCGNYEQMWLTTSLRGLLVGNLKVDILKEGVHSGQASGVIPSSFRIMRQLLSRVEDQESGEILPKFMHCEIPKERISQAKNTAETIGLNFVKDYPLVDGATPVKVPKAENQNEVLTELLLNKSWKPSLSVTGVDGIPSLEKAGNVLRTSTTLKLSFRCPPALNADAAAPQMKALLEANPPYGAHVTFNVEKSGSGWDSPALAPWLEKSLDSASLAFYNKKTNMNGEGGSIPFMGMLGEKFPKAQFVITGVLGPQSNAHGPNEFLHIDYMKKIICCVSKILHDHYNHFCASK